MSTKTFSQHLLEMLKMLNVKSFELQQRQQQNGTITSSTLNNDNIWQEVFYDKAKLHYIFKYLVEDDGMVDPDTSSNTQKDANFQDQYNVTEGEKRIIKIIIYDIVKFCPTNDMHAWDIIMQSSKFIFSIQSN